MTENQKPAMGQSTRIISPATRRGGGRRPVNPPIERASTMLSDDPSTMTSSKDGPTYGLEGGTAARQLRSILADMEGATETYIVPSGLASVTVPLMALLRPGDEVLCTDAVYGPSRRFLTRQMAKFGVTARFHPAEFTAEQIAASFTDRTKLLLIETPASLTFEMVDLVALTRLCREKGVISVVDNTWGAGLALKPIEIGADVSVQALTKYVGGHSDILMGSISAKDPAICEQIFETIDDNGWHVSPDDAWLALRGIRTMPMRYREQAKSALKVAQWLEQQPQIARVLYSPLPSSPYHHIWKDQFTGAASLIGMVMNGGDRAAAHRFMSALELFGMGYSWGGYESLITNDTSQLAWREHQPKLEGEILRIHIGLEDVEDLIDDLGRGLMAYHA